MDSKRIRFKELEILNSNDRRKYLDAIERVYMHGRFILGPEIDELEELLAEMTQRRYCVTVSSGTLALLISLLSLSKKNPSKKEVILPAYGWIASANAIKAAGLIPVFADVDNEFFIDPISVDKLITNETLAVMPVDFTGRIGAKVYDLHILCTRHSLPIIEDCAQAFGAWNSNNDERKLFNSGKCGEISCLSINPMKTLASHGEGGAILTDNPDIASFARRYRYQGMEGGSYVSEGLNARMETLQAAIVLENLSIYENIISTKRSIATAFNKAFCQYCNVPWESENEQHTYFSYQLVTPKRDELKNYLIESGIEVQIQHQPLMCDTAPYQGAKRSKLKNATRLSSQSLCLPCHEKLKPEEIDHIINKVQEFFVNS